MEKQISEQEKIQDWIDGLSEKDLKYGFSKMLSELIQTDAIRYHPDVDPSPYWESGESLIPN